MTGGGIGAWYQKHKAEALVGGAGIAVTVALYMRSKASSSSAASNTAAGTAPSPYASSAFYPGGVANTTGTDVYSGLESQILGLQQGLLTLQNPQGPVAFPGGTPGGPLMGSPQSGNNPPPAATGGASAPSAPAQFANQAMLGGSNWDVLGGFTSSGQYTGYNTLGGAPVGFTWNGQGVPEIGQLPPSGATGVNTYTPASTPLSEIAPVGQAYTPTWSQGYTGSVAA